MGEQVTKEEYWESNAEALKKRYGVEVPFTPEADGFYIAEARDGSRILFVDEN